MELDFFYGTGEVLVLKKKMEFIDALNLTFGVRTINVHVCIYIVELIICC